MFYNKHVGILAIPEWLVMSCGVVNLTIKSNDYTGSKANWTFNGFHFRHPRLPYHHTVATLVCHLVSRSPKQGSYVMTCPKRAARPPFLRTKWWLVVTRAQMAPSSMASSQVTIGGFMAALRPLTDPCCWDERRSDERATFTPFTDNDRVWWKSRVQ